MLRDSEDGLILILFLLRDAAGPELRRMHLFVHTLLGRSHCTSCIKNSVLLMNQVESNPPYNRAREDGESILDFTYQNIKISTAAPRLAVDTG